MGNDPFEYDGTAIMQNGLDASNEFGSLSETIARSKVD